MIKPRITKWVGHGIVEMRNANNFGWKALRKYIKYVLPTTNTLVLLYTSTRRVSTPRGHHQWLL
jgi:hypothetical protein